MFLGNHGNMSQEKMAILFVDSAQLPDDKDDKFELSTDNGEECGIGTAGIMPGEHAPIRCGSGITRTEFSIAGRSDCLWARVTLNTGAKGAWKHCMKNNVTQNIECSGGTNCLAFGGSGTFTRRDQSIMHNGMACGLVFVQGKSRALRCVNVLPSKFKFRSTKSAAPKNRTTLKDAISKANKAVLNMSPLEQSINDVDSALKAREREEPSHVGSAVTLLQQMRAIHDAEKDLGATLAKLEEHVKVIKDSGAHFPFHSRTKRILGRLHSAQLLKAISVLQVDVMKNLVNLDSNFFMDKDILGWARNTLTQLELQNYKELEEYYYFIEEELDLRGSDAYEKGYTELSKEIFDTILVEVSARITEFGEMLKVIEYNADLKEQFKIRQQEIAFAAKAARPAPMEAAAAPVEAAVEKAAAKRAAPMEAAAAPVEAAAEKAAAKRAAPMEAAAAPMEAAAAPMEVAAAPMEVAAAPMEVAKQAVSEKAATMDIIGILGVLGFLGILVIFFAVLFGGRRLVKREKTSP